MKRKSRRAKCQKVSPFDGELKLIEPDAAAIDVGSRSHWVAVNPQRDSNAVREFGTFTTDLSRLADWLAQTAQLRVIARLISAPGANPPTAQLPALAHQDR